MSAADGLNETSEFVVELECLYRETGNPRYAWEAFLAVCGEADKPLPSWVLGYLRGCAAAILTQDEPAWRWPEPEQGIPKPGHSGLLDLFDAVRDNNLSPKEAAKAVPQALGLLRGNRNAFADNRDLLRQADVAMHYESVARRGSSDAERIAISQKLNVHQAAVKRWVKRMRTLWHAQRTAKGASAPRGKRARNLADNPGDSVK